MNDFSGLELETEAPFRLVLIHPVTRQPMLDTEGNPSYIDHHSSDSAIFKKHQNSILRRRLAMRGRVKITAEELESETVEGLALVTSGWHLVDLQGNVMEVECNLSNARKLYAASRTSWVREQVEESMGDRGNFSQGSPKS